MCIRDRYGACLPTWMVESFPVHVRYTAVSTGYNVAQMMFGGTAPLIHTALTKTNAGMDLWPSGLMLSGFGGFALVGLYVHFRANGNTNYLDSENGFQNGPMSEPAKHDVGGDMEPKGDVRA
eukprot:TRINITY_DN20300_c0_g1_i1.p2 TRINITY_DN20300_c0_g1~~TRINITY_DN20300_c0_g1_i1.p2  ORF type:complete len:122 (-),score=23.13 TRINITY_DN20300_c0_g1_i1:131-496(-)